MCSYIVHVHNFESVKYIYELHGISASQRIRKLLERFGANLLNIDILSKGVRGFQAERYLNRWRDYLLVPAMIEIILTVVVGIAIGILFAYFYFMTRVELTARRLGDEIGRRVFEQQKAELDAAFEEKYKGLMEQWKVETEKTFRKDTLAKSRAVLKGALAEQLAPIFKVFGYNPSDARFIGDPVDYLIFDGYTEVRERKADRPITIVLADVKTGQVSLTYEQRRIK